jgi:hypothetical protein
LTRFVAIVAALGQLLVAAAAWADAAGDRGGDARPHVEQDGTRLHRAHVESECALCAAQHLIARPPAAAHGDLPTQPAARRGNQTVATAPAVVAGGVHLSRAPPIAT